MGDAGPRALEAARDRRTSEAGIALSAADCLLSAPRDQPDARGRRADRCADERGHARTGLGRSWFSRTAGHNRQDPKPAAAHAYARLDRRCAADARGGRDDGADRPLRRLIYRSLTLVNKHHNQKRLRLVVNMSVFATLDLN